MKKKTIITTLLFIIIISTIVIYHTNKNTNNLKENNNIKITKQINSNIDLDNGDEKINWDLLEEKTIKLNNKSIIIEEEGIYTLTGKITNGNITINTLTDIKIILDNVSITNNNGPAIIIEQANNTVIELKENTKNYLEDGKKYENTEYDGCLFSRDDLIIQGTGTLTIKSNYLDGIVSNDDLKIIDGTYNIKSNGDGIRGKDSVYIQNGTFDITSQNDGIKSTTATVSKKGFITIDNGKFTINSKEDAIQAETKLIINNGTFNIKTGDGSSATTSAIYKNFYNGKTYNETSMKALKSKDNLIINNGTFTIDSQDDAIHTNNYLGIKDGTINITSGDDGIHADTEIIIDNGTINIEKSYEGIESKDITINNGTISVNSNDDGINISGGNDESSIGNRPGQNPYDSKGNGILTINNGTITVNADGDGIDANGSIILNDGTLYIEGPKQGGNGIIDFDQTFNITSGKLLAIGNREMLQTPSTNGTQNTLIFLLDKTYNQEIILEDENNKKIISYTPQKDYSVVIISSPKIEKNKEYTLKINNKKITSLIATDLNTINGEIKNNQSPRPNGEKHHPPKEPR